MKLDSKYFDSIRTKATEEKPAKPRTVPCAWPGCTAAGEYRAPQGRGREGRYFQFCLAHVREYNNTYNYFSGMSDQEVAAFQKSAVTGHRPTWAMGARAAGADPVDRLRAAGQFADFDPYELFPGSEAAGPQANQSQNASKPVGKLARKSLSDLHLGPGATKAEIKAQFKLLVKRHHPDANGGDKGSEDRLREIIQAYNYLKQAGLC
ncbi:MAG: DnaJ domain-containing protein [Hyphomicrobiaceae bacterium]